MTLGRELDELDALEGEVFQNNKVIKAYRASIVSVINGTDMATAKFGENREAAIKLRRTISALNRATQENIKTNRDLRLKQFPITEADAFIQRLVQEERSLRDLISTQENAQALPGQERRLKQIKEARTLFTNIANVEAVSKRATLAIQVEEARLLAGKTKLLQKEVKSRAAIAQNQVKIFFYHLHAVVVERVFNVNVLSMTEEEKFYQQRFLIFQGKKLKMVGG